MARYSVNNYTVETLLSNIKSGSIAIEDNYFDLLPGTERILRFEDPSGQEPQARGLHWTSRNPKEENI